MGQNSGKVESRLQREGSVTVQSRILALAYLSVPRMNHDANPKDNKIYMVDGTE